MKARFNSREEAIEYIQTLPMNTIIEMAADSLTREVPVAPLKIAVTEEQLASINALFKIRGIAADGTAEKRGRKRKEEQ